MSDFHAWNPGLTSDIPARLMPLVTLYRAENSTIDYTQAREDATFCGVKPAEMVCFTPARLILHECLIRVTADLSVPDGPDYEVLGLNLRGMAAKLIEAHIAPHMDALVDALSGAEAEARRVMEAALDDLKPPAPKTQTFLQRVFGKEEAAAEVDPQTIVSAWASDKDELASAARTCLSEVATMILAQRGRLNGFEDIMANFALRRFRNGFGSGMIGDLIAPMVQTGADAEGYMFLPAQEKPLFMNVKGASAAGKSTIRPQQRELAKRLNIPWEEFALISPDYWRKSLLAYESLGEDYKYGAMLTGQELEIIDKKLDLYMAAKAEAGRMSHLLIDRFRFDSFANPKERGDSKLLTRFGDTVYMFFIITPPHETVERAWKRGLSTGRYKAVDDLLYHNIEAYIGMPNLFFSWALSSEKTIHFEFLDNDVPLGERPRTVAFGWNNQMTVLDPDKLRDIDGYRHVNIEAQRPEEVLEPAESRDGFLAACIDQLSRVDFADRQSLAIYARTEAGETVGVSQGHAGLASLGLSGPALDLGAVDRKAEEPFTLGAWG